MPDKDLAHWIQYFTDVTRKVIAGEATFAPMVFLVSGDEIANLCLVGKEEECPAKDRLQLFFEFGRHLSAEQANPEPDFICVGEILAYRDNRDLIVIHGCAADGQQGRGGFYVKRNWRKRMRPAESVEFAPEEDYNHAAEVLRGIRAGPGPDSPD